VLALLAAACTGPRTELPGYGQAPAVAAAPSPPPSPAFIVGAGVGSLDRISARLSQAILQPDMCNRLNCPRSGGYVVELIDDDAVNAATDGDRIYVTRGLLDFVATDGELAAVLAHEIAHGLLDHLGSKQQDAMLGAMLGAVLGGAVGVDASGLGAGLGALTYSKSYEREADYVGLYIMARAGYGLRDAYTMWQKMATVSTSQGSFLDSHPAFTERLALLRATNDEIAAKIRTRQPLVPALN
jgi:predicted Zn-dependent protease